jgi:ribokinase
MGNDGSIAILGVFVADTTFRAPRLPRMGETLLGSGFVLGPGGKGSNQAVAAARLGGRVHFVTRLGDDAFADLAERTWREAGVTPVVTRDAALNTGAAFIYVDPASGENAIIICPGAGGALAPSDVDAAAAAIGDCDLLLAQLEQPVPAAVRALEIARAAGGTTVLNPAPAAPLDDRVLGLVDYLTPNESEAEALAGLPVDGLDAARRAGDVLLGRGVGAVVLTLGAAGALLHTRDRSVHVAAVEAGPVVETTGAGDAFNGAFALALARGEDPLAAVRFGVTVAGLSVTRPGTAASMPSRADVEAFGQARRGDG